MRIANLTVRAIRLQHYFVHGDVFDYVDILLGLERAAVDSYVQVHSEDFIQILQISGEGMYHTSRKARSIFSNQTIKFTFGGS